MKKPEPKATESAAAKNREEVFFATRQELRGWLRGMCIKPMDLGHALTQQIYDAQKGLTRRAHIDQLRNAIADSFGQPTAFSDH